MLLNSSPCIIIWVNDGFADEDGDICGRGVGETFIGAGTDSSVAERLE